MANHSLDGSLDFDEGFFQAWDSPMLSTLSVPCAGTKRDAENDLGSHPLTDSGCAMMPEHPAEHIDPREICCSRTTCLPELETRPAKRSKVCHTNLEPDSDHPFLDTCFETFCRECTPCDSPECAPCASPECAPCASPECAPCASPECAPRNVCYDPHCDQVKECTDHCVDPECSKGLCPDKPCFCPKCDALYCPLGDLANECHFAHSAPDPSGTIYCFNNAPCHFQDFADFSHTKLSSYCHDGYQCAPPEHGLLGQCDVTAQPSSTATPLLSPGNHTSLESSFSAQSSPYPGPPSNFDCFLNIPDDHCHIDNSCCHGRSRACGDYPAAPQDNFGLLNLSLGDGDRLYNQDGGLPMGYGPQSQQLSPTFSFGLPTSTTNTGYINSGYQSNILGFGNNFWSPPEYLSQNTPQDSKSHNKLDYLASAAQEDLTKPDCNGTSNTSLAINARPTTTESPDTTPCICKWQHGPNMPCLQTFSNPSDLHNHIKTAHVENCTHCFCQWQGCDSSTKDFKQRSKLSRHLLGHAGHRPFACSWQGCTKTFATNQAKDNHERTHTGDRPYVCSECGYMTTTHTQLQTHISALHEKKKRYKCRFCDFSCADSSNLAKHERTHQALRPYRCPAKGCTFKPDCRWENLKRHLRRSGHCPELLVEGSEESVAYKENVRRETEAWQRRNEANAVPARNL